MRKAAGFPGWGSGALALASLVAVGGAIASRPYLDVALRLSGGRLVPATTVLAGLGLVGLMVAGVGLRFRRLALLGLAGLSLALAVTWLGLTDHRFSGPVVTSLSAKHGLHVTDALALGPALFGVFALAQALRRRPALALARR